MIHQITSNYFQFKYCQIIYLYSGKNNIEMSFQAYCYVIITLIIGIKKQYLRQEAS